MGHLLWPLPGKLLTERARPIPPLLMDTVYSICCSQHGGSHASNLNCVFRIILWYEYVYVVFCSLQRTTATEMSSGTVPYWMYYTLCFICLARGGLYKIKNRGALTWGEWNIGIVQTYSPGYALGTNQMLVDTQCLTERQWQRVISRFA